MSSAHAAAGPATSLRRPRVAGVDIARGVALLGMMSVHILPELDARGDLTAPFVLFAGRASALFAVLAGVGLALVTGGDRPRTSPWRAVLAGVLTRAVLVLGLGLVLGELSPPVAVILTNYGLLFVVGVAVLRLRPAPLLVLAACWVVATPLLSHALRGAMPTGPGQQPSLTLLVTAPVTLLRQVLVTGYYPVLTWAAYLFVGVAVGRLALGTTRTAARLLGAGVVLAVAARVVSDLLLRAGGLAALQAAGTAGAPGGPVPGGSGSEAVSRLQELGRYGVTPTTSWWWQAVATPHTGTPFDLATTIGSALAVTGAALLLSQVLTGRRVLGAPLALLAATGSMTLTLYTVHVLALVAGVGPSDRELLLLAHVVIAVVVATAVRATGRRGPLEAGVARAAADARAAVTPASASA